MADTTITSANSIVTITIPSLFPAPVQLSGYSADRAWETADLEITESQMGVDGRKTSGLVFNVVVQTFSLQADSPSKTIFNQLYRAMISAKDVFYIFGTIVLPSTGETFNGVRGTLKSFKPIPDAGKVLQPMNFVIEWESLQPSIL